MIYQQKDELIGKMVDCPQALTPREMEAIASDPELRDIYEASVSLAGAYAPLPDCDAESGWRQLRPRLFRRRRRAWFGWGIGTAAAALLGLAIYSGSDGPQAPVVAEVQPVEEVRDTVPETDEPALPPRIENVVADAMPVRRPARPKAAKREEAPMDSIEFNEHLRVAQARIDNDMAMTMAEVYLSDYNVTREMMLDKGLPLDEEMEFNINQLITP